MQKQKYTGALKKETQKETEKDRDRDFRDLEQEV